VVPGFAAFNLPIQGSLLLHPRFRRLLRSHLLLLGSARGHVVPHLVLGVKTRAAFEQDVDLEPPVLGHACVVEFLGVFCFIAFVVDDGSNSLYDAVVDVVLLPESPR